MTEPVSHSLPSSGDVLDDDVRALYDEVDQYVAAQRPICTNRGACCKFAEFGHKLYVTDVELSFFARGMASDWKPVRSHDACPYQVGGLCTAREHRPLGCRLFFCDPDAQAWQGPSYEQFLGHLKAIGEKHGIPYQYREWLSALGNTHPTGAGAAPTSESTVLSKPVDPIPLPVI